MTEVGQALDELSGLRDKPAGRVRLLMPRFAMDSVLAPKLGQFARDYPEITLDVTTDDSRMDLVAGGFDAGIHLGEYIEKDMIAVRVGRDHQPVIIGSPAYLESHPKPKSPDVVLYPESSVGLLQKLLDPRSSRNRPLLIEVESCYAL